MGWPDLSRWIWSYVISRLKLFTDLDPSKLELSARSLSVANVEIDKDRIAIPGVLVTQFIVEKLTIELTSSGISIGASGVSIDALVKSLEPPDLAISRILEQTRTDMEGYGGGDMSGIKSRFADFALAQMKARITDVRATLRYPSSDMRIRVHADQIVMNQKHLIEVESVILMHENCGSESDSDSFSDSSSTESESLSETEDGDLANSGNEDDVSQNRMAQSIFIGKRGSLLGQRSLAKSLYFDAQEEGKHSSHAKNEEMELGTINRIVLKFSLDPMEVEFDVDCVRLDGFLALQTIVDTLNLLWKTVPMHNDSSTPLKSGLTIAALDIYEVLSAPTSVPASVTDIRIHDGKLDVGGFEIPEVVNITPFLAGRAGGDEIHIDMTLPVSVALEADRMPYVRSLVTRVRDILSELTPPPDPRPTPIHISLPEFRLAIGQNFTLLVFPESLSNTTFTLREIVLTASEGQMLLRNLECQTTEVTGAFKNKVDELRVHLSSGFFDELRNIGELISGTSSPFPAEAPAPRRPWAAIDMPNTYWKIENLLVEDSEQVLMRGDMELRTVYFDADLRANLELDHQRAKTVFELSAYSNDGLKTIESTISFFDCDFFLERYTNSDSQLLGLPSVGVLNLEKGVPSLPEIRSKLDFGNGIRVHFPDLYQSIFAVSLGVVQMFLGSDGAISFLIPELFVNLEDSGGDVPLLKMEETNLSYFQNALMGPETSITVKKAALATCPDTYSLLTKLPALVIPPPLAPRFDVDPETSIDIFKDVSQTRFTPERLSETPGEDLAVTLDLIDIKENYMARQSQATAIRSDFTATKDSAKVTAQSDAGKAKVRMTIRLAQWQMFDGFDLERTRKAIGQAIDRIETAVAEANESDNDVDDEDGDRTMIGDFMYNSLFLVAQSGRADSALRKQVVDELGGTGPEGYARSSDPKLILTLRKTEVEQQLFSHTRSLLSVSIRDGKISDAVPTSAFSHLLAPLGNSKQKFLLYTQETVESDSSPELRVSLAIQPLHLQLDQDTVEFMNRFFQFDILDGATEDAAPRQQPLSSITFLQRFDFNELPLVIDYTPKKVDYKSLRSGAAAELVNLFIVKGAKLTLRSCVLHGISGWDRLLQEILGFWGPDIRANQVAGLLYGIWPVRKALKLGEGIKSWAIVPMQSKRTGQVVRGAGLLVRRTMDELLRLRTVWLDSAEQALGGDTDVSPVAPVEPATTASMGDGGELGNLLQEGAVPENATSELEHVTVTSNKVENDGPGS